jgi:NADH-quinone oxidoreductase subunit M
MGILSALLWTPAAGALLLALLPSANAAAVRRTGNGFAFGTLALACFLAIRYDPHNGGLQFGEYFPLNPRLGNAYALGVDGLSLPMLLLGTLLTTVAMLASLHLRTRVKAYYINMLLLEFGLLGVFLAQDWAFFYIFWEITLIPLFFLIDRWGGKRRHAASLNFVLYTMGGSVFMLISLLAIYRNAPEHATLMTAMAQGAQQLSERQQLWVFIGFLLGFGVKMPVFPLHGWLPLAHVEAPSPVSIMLSGILLKMGAYGLIRAVAMLPGAALALQPLLVFLALFGIVYGGLLAWRQTDLKAMIAYSSVSHMGVVLLGIAALNAAGLTGAVLQMSAHGLIAGALFLLVGLLYERTHTRDIQDYSSLVQVTPRFALFTTLALLAAMGLPGSVGFVAELHALIGGFQRWGWVMLFFSLGVLLAAAYAMRTIGQLFTGPVKERMQHLEDLRGAELWAASALLAGIVGLGVAPAPLIGLSAATLARLNALLSLAPLT